MTPENADLPADQNPKDPPRNAYFVVGEIVLHAQYKNAHEPDQFPNPDDLKNWVNKLLQQTDTFSNLAYTVVSSSNFNFSDSEDATSLVHISFDSLCKS